MKRDASPTKARNETDEHTVESCDINYTDSESQ